MPEQRLKCLSLSGLNGTASFETPPLAAPQDEAAPGSLAQRLAFLMVRRPKAVSNHEERATPLEPSNTALHLMLIETRAPARGDGAHASYYSSR